MLNDFAPKYLVPRKKYANYVWSCSHNSFTKIEFMYYLVLKMILGM